MNKNIAGPHVVTKTHAAESFQGRKREITGNGGFSSRSQEPPEKGAAEAG